MAEYLDINGLKKYDELIKKKINDISAGSVVYIPSEELQANTSLESDVHGGLDSHTAKWFAEKGFTISQMLDSILFKTVYAVLTEPSIAWKSTFKSKDVLVGTDITSMLISNDDVANYVTTNNGSWTLNSFDASNGHGVITLTTTNIPDAVNDVISMPNKTITFVAKTTFEPGNDPNNNKGVVQEGDGYKGGEKTTATISWTPYYDWYATTKNAGVLDKQSVMSGCGVSVKTTPEFTLQPHTSSKPQMIRIPKALINFQQFDTSSNSWKTIDLIGGVPENWERVQDSEKENNINYYTYTYTGKDRGEVKLKIKF